MDKELRYNIGMKNIYRVQSGESHRVYFRNGVKHRAQGPALVIGEEEYFFVDGSGFTKDEHENYKRSYNAYTTEPEHEEACYKAALESSDGIYVDVVSA